MAIKMKIAERKKPAPQRPYENRQQRIKEFIQRNEVLREMLRDDHPVIEFEGLHVSDMLTYRMRLRSNPKYQGVYNAQIFHLATKLNDVMQEQAFIASFYANLRAFLFWRDCDPHDIHNLMLIDAEGVIQWEAVQVFIERLFKPLPVDLEFIHSPEHDEYTVVFRSESAAPISMNIKARAWQLEYEKPFQEFGQLYINEAIGDKVIAQLSRAVHTMMTPEQADQFIADSQRPAHERSLLEEARAAYKAL